MDQINFKQLGLPAPTLRALEEMGFENATEIQAQSIPLIQMGYDVVGRSQTGTGKTAAFGIPAINMIDTTEEKRSVQVLLLCPTRELAVQAADEIKKIAKYTDGIKVVAVYGGAPMDRQIMQLRNANIVVGTPGRVMDHMRRHTLKLNNCKMIILDEADEMLSMGFREDIETILQEVPEERQTILFSATMPKEIMEIISNYQKEPQIIEINKQQVTLDAIGQFYYEVPMGRKNDMLLLLLAEHDPKRSIIFSNTKAMVDELTTFLNENGFKADGLHGDMKQSQRDSVMGAFKGGRTTILVATDVAARGIDVDDIDCVINYDIPTNNEYYVHRIGRTGRAGKSGAAYTICSGRRQVYLMQDIAKATKSEVIKLEIPTAASILKKQRLLKQEELISKMELNEELPYLDVVEELVAQGYSAEQIAAAALGMVYGVEESTLPVIQMEKKRRKGDFIKIRINIGREHRIAPNFIVGAIAERTSLSGQDIGKIEIFDEDTLVEIPRSSEEEVLSAMVGCKINGIDTETRRWLTKEEMKARKSRDFSEEAPKKERAPKEKGGFFHREKKEKKDWDKKEKHKDGKKFGFADRKPFNKEGKKDFKKNGKKGFGRDFKKDKKSEKKGNFGRSKKFLFDEE
ncbi:MAG: DEAD/DEAH box helicase [Oscillospiraceae bacterium]|nr:DEAD/DEAH box helicase [Oscillospiraceae bacterium]